MLTQGRKKTSDLRDRPIDEDAPAAMESIPNPGMFEQMLERFFFPLPLVVNTRQFSMAVAE